MSVAAAEIRPMTGIRGAAALFVMIYHFHLKMVAAGPWSSLILHGYLAVDLFFILSGFVMAHVYGQAFLDGTFRQRDFMLHRIARIYPLYIAMTLAFLVLAMVRMDPQATALPVMASNLVMLQAVGNWPSIDPPAWSVSTEMIAYLLFPAIAVACLKSNRWAAAALGGIAVLTILTLTLAAGLHYIGAPVAKGELDLFFAPYTLIRCLAGFTLGQLIYRLHRGGILSRLLSGSLVQCIVLVLVLASLAQALSDFPAYLAIMALILMLSEDTGIAARIFASPPLMLLGKVSFGIYLLHFKAIGLVEWLRNRALAQGMDVTLGDMGATLIVCTAVTAVAWVLHRLVETPLRRLIRKFGSPVAGRHKDGLAIQTVSATP